MASFESLPGVSTARPKHLEHAVETRRLQSFSTWPLWALQSPHNLAKAGFYYTGFADNVKCFYCDGGLRNWELMDNPWEEHARWFKECKYLLDMKGQAYVDEIQRKFAVGTVAANETTTPAGAIAASAAASVSSSTYSSASLLEHPSVQLVMGFGYSKELVEAALERIRSQSQTEAMPKGAELLHAVLQMEEEAAGGRPAVNIAGRSLPADERTSSGLSSVPQRTTPQFLAAHEESRPATPATRERALLERTSLPGPPPSERPLEPLQNIVFTNLLNLPGGEGRYLEENRQIHKHLECKRCRQRKAEVVLLPCGHFSSCLECIPSLQNCPLCATLVKGTIRTYLC